MSGRSVVITGGTSGIGAALAHRLRQAGDRVVVVGRRRVDHSDSIVCDLSSSETADCIEDGLRRLGVELWDRLIHCAGVGWVGAFPEQPSSSIREILRVNTWAPMALTHRLLSRASPNARIVFVSSPVAHWPSPDYAVYAASKAALEAFARALRAECSTRIEIQVVLPGATATEMLTVEDAGRLGIDRTRFATIETTATSIEKLIEGSPRWSGTDVASKLVAPLSRWGAKRLIRRCPRIAWHKDLWAKTHGNRPPIALITGAAEGIGRALALRFAAEGFRVVGVDRNDAGLSETSGLIAAKGGKVSTLTADLGDESNFPSLLDSFREFGSFDVVLHNAGINRFALFPTSNLADQEQVFAVNLVAPIVLTRELLSRRLLTKGCRLGFISSLSHFVGYPGSAVYAATKSGLATFAEGLSIAAREYGFSTTTIFPGPTKTRQAFENSPDNSREDRRTEPAVLADVVFRAMMKRKQTLVHGFGNRMAASIGLRFPSLTESLMRKALLKQKPEPLEAE